MRTYIEEICLIKQSPSIVQNGGNLMKTSIYLSISLLTIAALSFSIQSSDVEKGMPSATETAVAPEAMPEAMPEAVSSKATVEKEVEVEAVETPTEEAAVEEEAEEVEPAEKAEPMEAKKSVDAEETAGEETV